MQNKNRQLQKKPPKGIGPVGLFSQRARTCLLTLCAIALVCFVLLPLGLDRIGAVNIHSAFAMANFDSAPSPTPQVLDESVAPAVGEAPAATPTPSPMDAVQVFNYSLLQLHDDYPAVETLQLRLMELGYLDSDEPGTTYNEATMEAVSMFQRTLDTQITGIADSELQTRLYSSEATVYEVRLGAEGSDVRSRQNLLKELGYYEGKVNGYLNPLTWTNSVRDGSRGQVMNEIPMHYRKCYYPSANVYRVMMSEYPVPGYMQIPTMYCSAYEAALQRSTLKLASVVNTDADYRGGNNNAEWDGTYRSLIGMPASYISPTNFRTYARNRNGGDTQWNKLTYSVSRALYWLFVVEYATLNSQAPYNPELTAEGFRQGGLGQGVTTLESTKWSNYNNYHPFIPCGYTDEFGNGTGIKDFTMPAEYDPDATSPKVVSVARYRGIENPFGHLMKWVDGVNIMTSPTVEAGGDGLQHAYVCDDPAKFAYSVYGDPYRYVGALAANSGWIKKIHGGVYGDILPLEVGGSSTTFFCDYYSRTGFAEAVKHTVVALGGSASYGSHAGLSCTYATLSPSTAHAYYGSRLCFIPR